MDTRSYNSPLIQTLLKGSYILMRRTQAIGCRLEVIWVFSGPSLLPPTSLDPRFPLHEPELGLIIRQKKLGGEPRGGGSVEGGSY